MSRPTPPPSSPGRELLAFHGALCLLLSTLEYVIPRPIPFMRIGLANLPVLLALGTFDAPHVLLLVALKVLGQGFVAGTLFSYVFLFSAAGSLAAGLAMIGASRLGGRHVSLVGVSVMGALASNLVQVLLAVALVFGEGGWLIGPPFVAVGTVSAIALGLFARAFEGTSTWLAAARAAGADRPLEPRAEDPLPAATTARRQRKRPDLFGSVASPRALFLAGLAMLPPFLFVRRLELLAPLVLLALCLSLLSGRRFRPLFPLTAVAGIVAANLLVPSGRVLGSLGPLALTAGSLEAGLRKSLALVGLVYLSLFSVRAGLPLPGRLGGLLGRVVYYFERLLGAEKTIDRRDLLGSLDRLLWKVSPLAAGAPGTGANPPAPTRPTGRWILAGVAVLPWLALAADLVLS
jgi:uncharacterized membrane protein